jgi:predicted RNA-binding protein with PIN domain
VLVFDGHGRDETLGSLEVRYAAPADTLLERLAAENRAREQVAIVSSDAVVRGTAGGAVRKLSSRTFLAELEAPSHPPGVPGDLRDRLDPEVLARLEQLRRGK